MVQTQGKALRQFHVRPLYSRCAHCTHAVILEQPSTQGPERSSESLSGARIVSGIGADGTPTYGVVRIASHDWRMRLDIGLGRVSGYTQTARVIVGGGWIGRCAVTAADVSGCVSLLEDQMLAKPVA